ncbi:a44l protein-like protein [Novymonas esmeraldas]|uniref:A44l protein-like protein n=1 Tax=Novymonas esmeraldas TaxID=1808958 RepID=A0AAW0F784_9TRYP
MAVELFGATASPSSPALQSALEDSRLLTVVRGIEARVDAVAAVVYELLRDYSPLPVELTIVVLVFGLIALRQVAMWYTFDAPVRHEYVYWKMRDRIETCYSTVFLPEHHMASAVLVYLTQKLWRERPLTAAELRNKTFLINLLSLYCKPTEDEEYCDSEDEELSFRRNEKLMVPVKLPIYPCWTPTRHGGVEVCTWMSTVRVKNQYSEAYRSIFLRVRKGDERNAGGASPEVELRLFMEEALRFYFANGYCDQESHALRMYRVTPTPGAILVKSVPLPSGPTFDTVFFPQRDHVKALLQRFTDKKGRYAISGFPHKLGFLLYGPRGTGKRSFVRALAHHTRRHVVRVSLASLTRSDQLFSVFYFEAAKTGSTEEWDMLSSKKVIFLIEDVDTTSDVVCARGADHTARLRRSRGLTTRTAKSEEDWAVVRTTRAAAARPRMQQPISGWGKLLMDLDNKLDEVNLSSLLNVLDGAIEDPERIVVMITDHPERLDPALLRPGRLSTHVRFDYVELDQLLRMCGLFFGAVCRDVRGSLTASGARSSTSRDGGNGGGYVYTRMETHAAASAEQLHEALLATASCDPASSHPPATNAPGSTSAHACHLLWQRQDFATTGRDIEVAEKVILELSAEQASHVRECVAALEREAALEANGAYNFCITPSHVHHMCKNADSLHSFLDALSACIRGVAR